MNLRMGLAAAMIAGLSSAASGLHSVSSLGWSGGSVSRSGKYQGTRTKRHGAAGSKLARKASKGTIGLPSGRRGLMTRQLGVGRKARFVITS